MGSRGKVSGLNDLHSRCVVNNKAIIERCQLAKRERESSRHGDSDWTTSGVDRCYSGNVGRLLDPGEP